MWLSTGAPRPPSLGTRQRFEDRRCREGGPCWLLGRILQLSLRGAWDRGVPPCPRVIPPREAAPHQRQPPRAGPPGGGPPIRFSGAPRRGGAPSTEELLLEVDR